MLPCALGHLSRKSNQFDGWQMLSDLSSNPELFCVHLNRLPRDHWRCGAAGSSSGGRGQELEGDHKSGVGQDHKWLLQVCVHTVPCFTAVVSLWNGSAHLSLINVLWARVCSAGESTDWAVPESLLCRGLSFRLVGDGSLQETVQGCSVPSSCLFVVHTYSGRQRFLIHRSCSCYI